MRGTSASAARRPTADGTSLLSARPAARDSWPLFRFAVRLRQDRANKGAVRSSRDNMRHARSRRRMFNRREAKRRIVMTRTKVCAGAVVVLCAIATAATSGIGYAQVVARHVVDNNGAPQSRVDPFWPKPLPNKWSMQQIVGIFVDHMDHVWFLNRGRSALPIELAAEAGVGAGGPAAALCRVRGPALTDTDHHGTAGAAWGAVVAAGGSPGYHPRGPTQLQTVVVDTKGFVWVSGEANEDSILKFT